MDKMPYKELKRMIIKKLNEIQLNEIRKIMQDMNGKFGNKIEILKKNQPEIL
jgi:PHP family Zn ribbon phosphoesterase